jgi:hypothetical protein
MPNEPQIFYRKPAWVGLEEVGRTDTMVTFKTRSGTMTAFLKDVEAWEKKARRK